MRPALRGAPEQPRPLPCPPGRRPEEAALFLQPPGTCWGLSSPAGQPAATREQPRGLRGLGIPVIPPGREERAPVG